MIETGRVCLKIAGRDAGKKCVILSVKGNKAEVVGIRKKRTVSVAHLYPTEQKIDVKGSEEDIRKRLGLERAKTFAKKEAKPAAAPQPKQKK